MTGEAPEGIQFYRLNGWRAFSSRVGLLNTVAVGMPAVNVAQGIGWVITFEGMVELRSMDGNWFRAPFPRNEWVPVTLAEVRDQFNSYAGLETGEPDFDL